ncbi:ABC transporter substrate-binding protein [Vibrio sp. SS-MA-C1-2]|uniref:ABC transporter substrate-binding protein n=1 Tax=Vibrio sp. SS-MA-C1-2 TaxID=2908646 RepID=UPI001F267B31|nr:ABC transporter substrate-binding protein [Vibrio sp. SS-MA-C1-2]UJF18379.1 ABC transporter substrate-binding protein [Vibrio sp. SS-MA-C1-2]
MKRWTLTLTAALLASSFNSIAAQIPEGVTLAKQQHLTRGNDAEVATLDPANAEGMPEIHVLRDLFEGLVIQDSDGNVIPGVAASWETRDNKTFTFHLRPDLKWSNGDPLTADDFVYSLKRAASPDFASANGWYLKLTKIKNMADILEGKADLDSLGIKALDDQTLQYTLETQVPYFVAMMAHTSMMPIHQASVEKYGVKWTHPENMVSNGAYTLKNWVVNERIDLAKNNRYWDAEETVITDVTYIPFESQTAAMNRYMAGEVDITSDVPTQMAKKLQKEYRDAYTVVPLLCTYYYTFNTTKAPFDDPRVRKAVSYSIMRDVITNGITNTGNVPAYTFAHKYVAGFKATQPEYSQWTQKQRDQKAQQLLAEAGYNQDNPLKFHLLYNTSESHKAIATAIAAMLKNNLKAEVELENQEWKSYLVSRRQGAFDVLRSSWCGDYNEASTFLSLMTSGNSGNYARFSDPEYDNVIEQALLSTNQQQRNSYYDKAEQILSAEMPIAPIYDYMQARLVRPTVGGFPLNNVEGRIYSKNLYIKASK